MPQKRRSELRRWRRFDKTKAANEAKTEQKAVGGTPCSTAAGEQMVRMREERWMKNTVIFSLQPGMSNSPVAADWCRNGDTFLRSAFQAVAKWRGIITGWPLLFLLSQRWTHELHRGSLRTSGRSPHAPPPSSLSPLTPSVAALLSCVALWRSCKQSCLQMWCGGAHCSTGSFF